MLPHAKELPEAKREARSKPFLGTFRKSMALLHINFRSGAPEL